MRTAQQLHLERLTDEQARCFTIEWLAEIQREAFDAGATAMRDRIMDAVVGKVEAIDVTTTEGRP